MSSAERPIDRLISIMAPAARSGNGCPWDVEQTFATVAPYTVEEAYEVADAIERGDLADLKEELGESAAAGRVPRPHGRGTGGFQLRRRGDRDRRQAGAPPSPRLRGRPLRQCRRADRRLGGRQGRRTRRQGPRQPAGRRGRGPARPYARAEADGAGGPRRLRLARCRLRLRQAARGDRRAGGRSGGRRPGQDARGAGRHPLRLRQPGPLAARRTRGRAAFHQRQVRAPFQIYRGAAGDAGQDPGPNPTSPRWTPSGTRPRPRRRARP